MSGWGSSVPPPPGGLAPVLALLGLARDNKAAEIEAIVAKGMPVDACNQMGQTAIHIAALWGNVEAVQTLAKLGADVNVQNVRGTTPLHFAASAKNNVMEVCKLLLSLGAKQDAIDMTGRCPYEMAASNEVRALLGGPDPRIFQFCSKGQAKELAELLAAGAEGSQGKVSVRVVDEQGRTPLNLAVGSESLDTVKVILQHDASVLDVPDSLGDSALHVAAGVGDAQVLEYLLSLNPESINAQNLDSSEYSAGNWMLNGEVVEPLNKTPLAVAVEAGDVDAVKLLLAAGSRVDIEDYDKRTPLHTALEDGEEDIAVILLEHGADPNTPSQDFVSPLHMLATRGSLRLLSALIAKGGNVNATNEEGWTPLHLACRGGKLDKVQALLAGGAQLDALNAQGNTPLHLASVNGHAAIVQVLLQHKAAVDVLNKAGQLAKDMAKNDATRQCFE